MKHNRCGRTVGVINGLDVADRELYVLTSVSTGPTGNRDVVYKIVPAQ
jgi:hypothetical protein